ncbi:MAG: alpha/beta fold hydrolase, partial [Runella zeae]
RLTEWRERWLEIGLRAAPADRGGAREGVVAAYAAANLKAPAIFVWLRSPLTRLYTADDRAIINLSEIIADYHGDHFINPRINPDFGSPSTLQLLSKIQSPLLILVGEKDEESMHRIAKILETQIPYSQKRIIKGAGHLSNMDKPKIFNHLALSFLRKKP